MLLLISFLKQYWWEIILVVIGAIFITWIKILQGDISGLNKSIEQYKKDAVISELQIDQCKISVIDQNNAINRISVDLNKTTSEYNKWKNQPEKVRYQVIYKNKVMEVKSNDCKDVNNTIDAVRNIDYNEL